MTDGKQLSSLASESMWRPLNCRPWLSDCDDSPWSCRDEISQFLLTCYSHPILQRGTRRQFNTHSGVTTSLVSSESDDISLVCDMTCEALPCVIRLYNISGGWSLWWKKRRCSWMRRFCQLSRGLLTTTSSLPITLWALMTQLTDLAHFSTKTTSRCSRPSSSRGRSSTMTSTWKALQNRRGEKKNFGLVWSALCYRAPRVWPTN